MPEFERHYVTLALRYYNSISRILESSIMVWWSQAIFYIWFIIKSSNIKMDAFLIRSPERMNINHLHQPTNQPPFKNRTPVQETTSSQQVNNQNIIIHQLLMAGQPIPTLSLNVPPFRNKGLIFGHISEGGYDATANQQPTSPVQRGR